MRELDQKALEAAKWEIDYSAGSPILTYEKCSVIQDEQAHYIMRLLRQDAALPSAPAVEGVERELVERLEAAIAEAEFGHESPTHVRALVAHLKTATSAISSLQRLVDGIDGERRGALDLCIERNKQIQALDKEISRLTASPPYWQRQTRW